MDFLRPSRNKRGKFIDKIRGKNEILPNVKDASKKARNLRI